MSTKATEADPKEEHARTEEAAENKTTAVHETAALELGDLMTKLNQIDKKLKYSEEDRDLIRKELKYNKQEYLDSYFNLAKATDERLQQMSDKVDATNEERDKNIKKDMHQLKNRYDDVNSQLGSLEKRMDIMNRNQAESSCAIQAKLDAILRNSTSQERPMGHQGIDKVQQRILHRFDWPAMRKACERWVNACLARLQVKDPRKMKFPLKSVESSEFNEVVQIDHQKICMTESGYNQILVKIDHFTKLAEAVPCQTASAEETCDHLITHWISRYGCPMTFQSDNGKAFVGDLTKELMKRSLKHIRQPTIHRPTGW